MIPLNPLNGGGRYAEVASAHDRSPTEPEARAGETTPALTSAEPGGTQAMASGGADGTPAGAEGRIRLFDAASALFAGGRHKEADLAYARYLADAGPGANAAPATQQSAPGPSGGRPANSADIDKARRAFDRGSELMNAGRYAEALEQYEKAYRFAPAPETLFNRALCLEKLGRREEASKLYAQYAKEVPTAPDAAHTARHAETLHKEALTLASAAFSRGEAALREHRYRDAAMAFAEANTHVPSSAARYNGALALDRAGETAQAVREYQRYLNETPNAPDAAQVRERIQALQAQTGNELMKP